MKLKLASLSLIAVMLMAFVLAPLSADAARPATGGSLTKDVSGTFTDVSGGTGTFSGTYTITRFVNQNGQLAAVGTLSGTLTDSVGTVLGTVTNVPVTVPVTGASSGGAAMTSNAVTAAQAAGCEILNLDLGPLDLNLLGLQVHLDEVVLNITAVPGAGNLLGNLLCAVANLLNGGGPLGTIANLLNQILGVLNGLGLYRSSENELD